MTGTPRPLNFVAEVNGHHIYRNTDDVLCNIWTAGIGWWGFGLREDDARRHCAIVARVDLQPVYGTE